MGRENIYSTLGVSSVVPTSSLGDLLDFLVVNRGLLVPTSVKEQAFKSRFSGNSLIADIVRRIAMQGQDQTFSLIKLPNKSISLREIVDMSFIPFDIAQLKDATGHAPQTLDLIPELKDKIVINITDITRANGEFSDITQFHQRVVRDFLSRSFYNSSGSSWLQPALVRYIAKVYNMTIGGQIARMFDLSPIVKTFVQTVFCLFFIGKMSTPDQAGSFMKANARALGIFDSTDMPQIIAFVEDVLGKKVPDNLLDVCKVIDSYEHGQLSGKGGSRLTLPVLGQRFSTLTNDGQISRISIEYPPYFAFLILLVLSNVKIGLSFHMKTLNLINEGRELFNSSVKSPTFLGSI